jgi:hypothetical protein
LQHHSAQGRFELSLAMISCEHACRNTQITLTRARALLATPSSAQLAAACVCLLAVLSTAGQQVHHCWRVKPKASMQAEPCWAAHEAGQARRWCRSSQHTARAPHLVLRYCAIRCPMPMPASPAPRNSTLSSARLWPRRRAAASSAASVMAAVPWMSSLKQQISPR